MSSNSACILFGLRLFRTRVKCIRNYCVFKNLETLLVPPFFEFKRYCACANATTEIVIQYCMYLFWVTFFTHTSKRIRNKWESKNPETLQKSQFFRVQELLSIREPHYCTCYTILHVFGLSLFRARLKCIRNYCASKNLETLQKSNVFQIQELLRMSEPHYCTCYTTCMYPFWVEPFLRSSKVHQKLLRIQKPRNTLKIEIFSNPRAAACSGTPILYMLYNFAWTAFALSLSLTRRKCIRKPRNAHLKNRSFSESKSYCACAKIIYMRKQNDPHLLFC